MPENTAPAADPDLLDPNGRIWHPTAQQRAGKTLYVIDGVDGEKCSPIALSTKFELESIFGTEMHAAGAA